MDEGRERRGSLSCFRSNIYSEVVEKFIYCRYFREIKKKNNKKIVEKKLIELR
jgi:hypothetical protein